VIVGHDGEVVDALGPSKSNLVASVGITGRRSPNVAGQVSLDSRDGVSVSGESDRQIIAYVVGDSAYHPTGIGDGPDLRGNSGFFLRGEKQTAFVWQPHEVMDCAPVPAGHGLLSAGGDVDLYQRA